MHIHYSTSVVFFTHKGKQPINQDAIYVAKGQNPNLCIVADGVGGSPMGEVASAKLVDVLVKQHQKKPFTNLADITAGIRLVDEQFIRYAYYNPSAKGMATTLAMVLLTKNKCIAAHIGDSRMYHYRNGDFLYISKDHNAYEEKIAAGISLTMAAQMPDAFALTNCICGDGEPRPFFYTSDALQKGDILLLCTDGVLESFTNSQLLNLMKEPISINEIGNKIQRQCAISSSDNFSFVLVKLDTL